MSDRRRTCVFVGAAILLLGVAAVLALVDRGAGPNPSRPRSADASAIRTGPQPASETPESRGSPGITPSSTSSPTAGSAPRVTRREHEAHRAPAIAPREARAATVAARAFLDGYLPYSYGHAGARRIRAAAARLLRELEASPPRIPATVAGAHPRVISVHALAATGDHAVDVLALVADGRRRYDIPLAVSGAGGRWVVTAVSG